MINNWSDKYASGRSGAPAAGRSQPGRFYVPAIAVLTALVLLLCIFGGQAIAYRGTSRQTFINRMLTECDEALASVKNLSRSGGAESSAILGRIRANIHAIDAINGVNNAIAGGNGYFVEPAVFTQLYGVIDSFSNNLKLGNVTIEELNNLTNGLEALKEELAALN